MSELLLIRGHQGEQYVEAGSSAMDRVPSLLTLPPMVMVHYNGNFSVQIGLQDVDTAAQRPLFVVRRDDLVHGRG